MLSNNYNMSNCYICLQYNLVRRNRLLVTLIFASKFLCEYELCTNAARIFCTCRCFVKNKIKLLSNRNSGGNVVIK
jgi:hypothetical protein